MRGRSRSAILAMMAMAMPLLGSGVTLAEPLDPGLTTEQIKAQTKRDRKAKRKEPNNGPK